MRKKGLEVLTPTGGIYPEGLLPEDTVIMNVISGSTYRFTVEEVTIDDGYVDGLHVPSGRLAKISGGELNETFNDFDHVGDNEVKARAAQPLWPWEAGHYAAVFNNSKYDISDRHARGVQLPRLWQVVLLPGELQRERMKK